MKKLSIEEKAKRYDEAIERAESIYNETAIPSATTKGICTYIFPELKESEDELMIQYFKDLAPFDKADELYEKYGFSHKDAIAWLEKQCGHDKFINGIQVGDKVTRNEDGVLVNLSQLNRVAKKQCEQKPAEWSEEIEAAISLLKHIAEEQEKDYCPHNANALRKAAQYLESIRPQNTWKPSDEQIEALESATENCAYSEYQGCLRELIEQLKKLKE